jgi:hypothetical protein
MSQLDPTCGIAIFAKMRPWLVSGNTSALNVPIAKITSKIKPKARSRKEIIKSESPTIYPIFAEASAFAPNTFWKTYLLDASKGFIPAKFSFNYGTNTLSYKNRTKIIECHLDISNFKSTAELFQNFLRVYGGITSPDEVEASSRERDSQERKNIKEINSWKEIRSISQKRAVIYRFVSNLGIDRSEWDTAVSTINRGLLAGYFNSDNIKVNNGQIVSIDGLISDPNERYCRIDPAIFAHVAHKSERKKAAQTSARASGKRNTAVPNWEKFLIDLERKLIRRSLSS